MRHARILLSVLIGALVASSPLDVAAQDPIPAKARCLTSPKGYLQKALALKLRSDLSAAGLANPKVRVKLTEIAPEAPTPATSDLTQFFGETKLTVTRVECIAAPCPPEIKLPESSASSIQSCTVRYAVESKFSYALAAEGSEGSAEQKTRFNGTSAGNLTVSGTLAPIGAVK